MGLAHQQPFELTDQAARATHSEMLAEISLPCHLFWIEPVSTGSVRHNNRLLLALSRLGDFGQPTILIIRRGRVVELPEAVGTLVQKGRMSLQHLGSNS